MKTTYLTIGIIIVIVVFGVTVLLLSNQSENVEVENVEVGDAEIDYASDVVGTRVGTSTTGATFYGDHTVATTTYKIRAGGADMAVFTMKATDASTTPASSVQLSIFGSNDWECETASTSAATLDTILTSDINWYDISSHIDELAGSTTLTGTTTIHWNPATVGQGENLVLKNLNYECIRLDVSASSTELLIQVRLK